MASRSIRRIPALRLESRNKSCIYTIIYLIVAIVEQKREEKVLKFDYDRMGDLRYFSMELINLFLQTLNSGNRYLLKTLFYTIFIFCIKLL